MKDATFAPAYVAFYPMLAEIARDHGYALAIHGSVTRDFDLIAIPWRSDALDATDLINKIAKYASMFTLQNETNQVAIGPEIKPHGRRAWSILMGNGAVIDLSVMPLIENAD